MGGHHQCMQPPKRIFPKDWKPTASIWYFYDPNSADATLPDNLPGKQALTDTKASYNLAGGSGLRWKQTSRRSPLWPLWQADCWRDFSGDSFLPQLKAS
jgi:hypothetical protein